MMNCAPLCCSKSASFLLSASAWDESSRPAWSVYQRVGGGGTSSACRSRAAPKRRTKASRKDEGRRMKDECRRDIFILQDSSIILHLGAGAGAGCVGKLKFTSGACCEPATPRKYAFGLKPLRFATMLLGNFRV